MNDQFELTHSSIETAGKCLRAYYLSYIVGLQKDRDSEPLRFGSNIHDGIDWLSQGVSIADVCSKIRERYSEPPVWVMSDIGDELDKWFDECERCLRTLCVYDWRWTNDECEIIATEQEFDLPLINPATGRASTRVRIRGKIDKIVRLADGRLAVREHKTTIKDLAPGSDFWKTLKIDQQISMYVLAARMMGHDIATVEYDVIGKTASRPKNPNHGLLKDNKKELAKGRYYKEEFPLAEIQSALAAKKESLGMYGARLSTLFSSDIDKFFVRKEIPRIDSDIEEFRYELWQMQNLIRQCRNNGYWFKRTASCLSPYRCEFCDICFAGISVKSSGDVLDGYRKKERIHMELSKGDNNGDSTATASGSTTSTNKRTDHQDPEAKKNRARVSTGSDLVERS